MHAEQLFRRPPEPVRLGAVPLDEVECVAPGARPCVGPEAGTWVVVGQEGEGGIAPGMGTIGPPEPVAPQADAVFMCQNPITPKPPVAGVSEGGFGVLPVLATRPEAA
jgi:hypothetical protein